MKKKVYTYCTIFLMLFLSGSKSRDVGSVGVWNEASPVVIDITTYAASPSLDNQQDADAGIFGGENLDGAEIAENNTYESYESDKVEESAENEIDTNNEAVLLDESGDKIDYEKIKPNEIGEIMVIMYHGLYRDYAPQPFHRTIAGFKDDLQKLYDGGYRLLSLRDLIDNNINVEAGYTPVVLTFDDGLSTAFSLVEEDGKLVPTPDCAVDIINKFSEAHPDFGKSATLFITGSSGTFKGAGTMAERLTYLVENGYDIGNHTYSHKYLSQLGADKIQEEIGKLDQMVRISVPGYEPICVAYPYGSRPQNELKQYMLKGSYNSVEYSYEVVIREAPCGTSATPNHVKFDLYNVPRVRGSDNANTDLGWSIRYYAQNPQLMYVSDGNPDIVAVPEKNISQVNMDSLGDKKLYIYDRVE